MKYLKILGRDLIILFTFFLKLISYGGILFFGFFLIMDIPIKFAMENPNEFFTIVFYIENVILISLLLFFPVLTIKLYIEDVKERANEE